MCSEMLFTVMKVCKQICNLGKIITTFSLETSSSIMPGLFKVILQPTDLLSFNLSSICTEELCAVVSVSYFDKK